MKKILLTFMFLISCVFGAGDINFYHDYASGAKAAKKEHKMMMIMIHVKGCPECNYMKEVIFTQPETKQFMSQNFVNLLLDFKETEIPSKYTQIGVPTFYFTDPDGNIVHKQIGAVRGNKFIKVLQEAKAKYK